MKSLILKNLQISLHNKEEGVICVVIYSTISSKNLISKVQNAGLNETFAFFGSIFTRITKKKLKFSKIYFIALCIDFW